MTDQKEMKDVRSMNEATAPHPPVRVDAQKIVDILSYLQKNCAAAKHAEQTTGIPISLTAKLQTNNI